MLLDRKWNSIQSLYHRFFLEPALSEDTKIPRFARNDRDEEVEMTEKGEWSELLQINAKEYTEA
jgi:hypothetical protein